MDIKTLQQKLVDCMLAALDEGTCDTDQSKESANFILDESEKIKTEKDLDNFLTILVARWPFYEAALKEYGFKKVEKEDDQKLKSVQDKLQALIGAQHAST